MAEWQDPVREVSGKHEEVLDDAPMLCNLAWRPGEVGGLSSPHQEMSGDYFRLYPCLWG